MDVEKLKSVVAQDRDYHIDQREAWDSEADGAAEPEARRYASQHAAYAKAMGELYQLLCTMPADLATARQRVAALEVERDAAALEADLLRVWATNLIRTEQGELDAGSSEAKVARAGLAAELEAIKAAGLDAAREDR
jgi:hypothetical protein